MNYYIKLKNSPTIFPFLFKIRKMIPMMALGRRFKLGDLYDYSHDSRWSGKAT